MMPEDIVAAIRTHEPVVTVDVPIHIVEGLYQMPNEPWKADALCGDTVVDPHGAAGLNDPLVCPSCRTVYDQRA